MSRFFWLRGPTMCVGAALFLFLLATLLQAPAMASLPSDLPTLSQIQQAITDSSAGWTAAANPIWNLTWQERANRLGCNDSKSGGGPARLETPIGRLPASLDWTNNNGNHISSVKNQSNCGSCWAHAACGVMESMREIAGLTNSGTFDDLSEQFIVSCDANDSGCSGGNGSSVSNFVRDTGVTDEACFPYVAADTACANRCNDWSSRLRNISSWSWVRAGTMPSNPGAVDSIKSALQSGPLWITMRVLADFYAYNSGIYSHVIGPWIGNHAIVVVGYDDNNSCFKCKNSWGSTWGENGYFRIAYSQVYGRVLFGKYTIAYNVGGGGGGGDDYSYGFHGLGMHWRPATLPIAQLADDKVFHFTPSFAFKYYGRNDPMLRVSTNGWASFGSGARDDYAWPDHYPIPDPRGPSAMIAPLWTDLDPTVGGQMLTDETSDGRFIVEYRNVLNKSTGTRETFEIILLDPARYPTFTGDGLIQVQYQQHATGADYFTTGTERWHQTSGLQVFFNGQGMPITPGTSLEFYPVPHGDEAAPRPPESLIAAYGEPFVRLSWRNPTQNVNGFDLLFLTTLDIYRDGTAIAQEIGSPGEAMAYADRGVDPGTHAYQVIARVGSAQSAPASAQIQLPARVDMADHNVGNATLTVTDQGICGFLSGGGPGSGFIYPRGGQNCLYIGSLWAATDSVYALNRDFAADPYADWLFRRDVEGPGHAISNQDYLAAYDDAGSPYAKDLRVRQDSWAWSQAPFDDFVIIRYTLTNASSQSISPLYVGQYMDWDITSDASHNEGAVDPALRMAYMWSGTGHPYAGVALMDTLPDNPPLRNLTMVHNPTFVWPQSYLLDRDRYLFLTGGDAAHSVAHSTGPDDWSALVSAGPYHLNAGDSIRVAFAVLGGNDLADLRANAVRAYQAYTRGPAAVEGGTGLPLRLALRVGEPNPFSASTMIHYALPAPARVELSIYEASGRLLRTLVHGTQGAGDHAIRWDGTDQSGRSLPSGIYFCRLRTRTGVETRTMVLIH